MMKEIARYAALFGGAALVGILASRLWPARVDVQTVKVPVPIECREPVPARPAMPVEALRTRSDPVDVDQFVQAALAEIARREGYERQLLAALNACRAPVGP